jgi:hypothetical protein
MESIENRLDKKTKLKEGIFFTSPSVVEEISRIFDYGSVKSVIDSAAGSCNFLIPLARQYSHIQFYGVEKNETIYETVKTDIEDLPNLHYYRGDILLDDLPVPPCDLYLGNPPFVNYTNLTEDYREKIKSLWKKFMPVSRGFSLLLGDSRGDIAGLIFYYTLYRYVKDSGQFGVILPNSLIKGNGASAGFREFNNISIQRIVDISHRNAFLHTQRACFYMTGKKGGITAYPIPYVKQEEESQLWKRGDSLIEDKVDLAGGSDYPVRQGINTLGANGVFFFTEKPDLEEELLHPLLRSGDVGENRAEPSRWALLPYDGEGKLLPPSVLEEKYPKCWAYLLKNRHILAKRKSRFARKNWYTLFGIGSYTFAPYKVVWRAMGAKKLEAAVITRAIPNQAMHGYISCDSRKEADYLCNLLNSNEIRHQAAVLSESRSRSFAQPGTMKQLPLKKYKPTSEESPA